MPANTTRGYPYPIGTDVPDVAGDVKRLAEAIDTDVASLGGGGITDVVWVGNDAPVDPATEMWWDADEPQVPGAADFGQADADLLYVKLPGDTMTGPLVMNAAFIEPIRINATAAAAERSIGFYDSVGTHLGFVGFRTSGDMIMAAGVAKNCYVGTYTDGGFLSLMSQGATKVWVHPGIDAAATKVTFGTNTTGSTTQGVEIQNGTVAASRADAGGWPIKANHVNAAATSYMAGWCFGNAAIGSVTRNTASNAAVVYNTTSHAPWKEIVGDTDAAAALAEINQWRVKDFRWKYRPDGRLSETGTASGEVYHGFIAQELQAVAPYAVTEGEGTEAEHWAWIDKVEAYAAAQQSCEVDPTVTLPDDPGPEPFMPWMIDKSMLVPKLVAAVQALAAKVAALEGAP